MNSKQLDPTLFSGDDKPSWRSRISEWVEEHNPIPYRVRFWFNDQDIFHPSRIWRKTTNVIRWIPTLWKDADWDYAHLYDMIDVKLTYMIEHHKEHHNHVDWEKVVEQMTTARDAIRRLRNDDYVSAEYDEHLKKFPEQEWLDLPGKPGWKQSAPLRDGERDSIRTISDIEEKRRQDDLELFTSTFKKHVREWWD